MPPPLVSILMPSYNTARFLPEAIDSVLHETYPHFELLICDDASTDGSLEIARRYEKQDPRVRVFARAANSGSVSVIYRFLAAAAQGRYLIISDSDDVALPQRLEVLVALAERRPDASLVYGTVHGVSADLKQRLKVYDEPFCPFRLFGGNYIPDGGALIRKSAYDAIGGYDAAVKWAEDYELRLRLATVGPMIHTDQLVYLYRRHGKSWTAKHSNYAEERRFKQQILDREAATVARVVAGQITSYHDAAIAAYFLATARFAFPRPKTMVSPVLLDRLTNRLLRFRSPLLRVVARGALLHSRRAAARAWKRTRLLQPRVDRPALEAALAAAGLAAGDTALVHCSLSSLGWMAGGAPTVIASLKSAVGAGGTLLMPTFTSQCDLGPATPPVPPSPARRFRPDMPSSLEMGRVAETFRRQSDTHRIYHPGLSLAVWGKNAAVMTQRYHGFDSFSSESPVAEIYAHGKIVMIGTEFDTLTVLHLAEYLAAVPYQDYRHYFGTSLPDRPIMYLRTTGASAAFGKLTGLMTTDLLRARSIAVGGSHVTVLEPRALVDFAAQMLRYLPDFLLGFESPSCRDRRRLLERALTGRPPEMPA